MGLPTGSARLATIPRGFNNLNASVELYYTSFTGTLFANTNNAITSYGVFAPYFPGAGMISDVYYINWSRYVERGEKIVYDKSKLDLSLYNVSALFLKETPAENWTKTNTQAVTQNIFIVDVDEIENSVTVRLNGEEYTQSDYNKFSSDYVSRNEGTTSFLTLFFDEKTPSTQRTITQNLTNVTSSYSGSSVADGTTITVNLSVNDGYSFTSTPFYTMSGNVTSFTQTENGYTADITVTDDLTITATASLNTYTITQNLNNVTSSYSGSSVTHGTNITVNLTANSGYNFQSVPTYTMGGDSYNFTETATGYTANITVTGNLTITAAAVLPVMYNLNQTLTYCECNYTAGQYAGGTVLNLILTPTRENYGFKETPVIISGGTSTPFIVSSDRLQATLTWTLNAHSTIRGTAKDGTQVRTNLTYCEITSPASFPLIFEGDTLVFNIAPISSLYEFQEIPFVTLSYFEGSRRVEGTLQADGSYSFNVETNASLELEDILITGRAGIKQASSKYGLVNMYSPTIEELETLAETRFQNNNSVDLGQFIISLRKMYCNIPTIGKDVIDMGYYFSPVETDVINTDTVVISCGVVTIGEQFQNAFDYSPNSQAEIFLPLIGFNTIDVNKIMGRNAELVYYFNIMTNDITVILKQENGVNIETWTGKGGFDIPFIYNAYTNSVRNNVDDIAVIYAGFTPFIRITSHVPYYPTATDTDARDTKKYMRIGDNEGYTEIDEVDFNATGQITSVEIQEIKNLLRAGVVLPISS